MKRILKMTTFVFLIGCLFVFMGKGVKAEAGINIVLDPGHDSSHTGANGNGIHEEEVNFKIAQFCKEELEKYEGISGIYMTRNSYACPYPGTTSTQDNKKRVEFAKSVGANLYVSIHNNSSANSSVNGATVYYPNSNYLSDVGKNGEIVAGKILNNLLSLGLTNRGIQIRNSEDNTRYPDGSLADYYGVIKNGKLAGFTSIIIEHAFVSNAGDASKYLSDDTKLKLLGIADAKGIAEYYGFEKKSVWNKDVSAAKLTTSFSSDNKKIVVSVSGLSKAPEVKFAVWSSSNNQKDLKWYAAGKKASGDWVCEIPLTDYKVSGGYNIHAYAHDGRDIFACAGTINVPAPGASSIEIKNLNFANGTFDVNINNVTAKSGINNVRIAVWSRDDKSDMKWLTASKVSGNDYKAQVEIADYFEPAGTFHIHAYALDNIGINGFLINTNYKLEFPEGNVAASIDEDANCFEVSASAITYASLADEVKAAVWSSENGQDDISWYKMTKTDEGWKCNGNMSEHITAEGLDVHVYAFLKNGTSIYVGSVKNVLSSSTQSDEIAASDSDDSSKLKWNGKKVSVVAASDIFNIKLSADAAEVTDDTVKVSESNTFVSEDSAAVSEDAAIASGDAAIASNDAVDASENAAEVTISPLDVVKLRETDYAMKDSAQLYTNVNKSLAGIITNKEYNFFITGVEFLYDNSKYICERNGNFVIQFVLPKQYYNKNIAIYKISDDLSGKVEKQYNNVIAANGYAQITAESEGTYVVAVLSDKIVEEDNYLYGDLDFNGKIDLNDAKLSLKASLGIVTLSDRQKIVSDYNRDGKYDLNDTKAILKKSLGID